jgi:Tol biopolymer transport system component
MVRATIGLVAVLVFPVTSLAQFTPWSAPVKVEGEINSNAPETCVAVSKDHLTLYFARSSSSSGLGGFDLYFSKRDTLAEPWGTPSPVPHINSSSNDFCPALSLDEHRLYFASVRPDGNCGIGTDIYVSRRHDRRNDLGWGPPENLGCELNSPGSDQAPSFFEDESGAVLMYFATNREPSQGFDIYQSRQQEDDTFGPATPVSELNVATFNEIGTAIRRDGLEIIVDSTRPGGLGGRDLWGATRESTRDPWSPLVNLRWLNSGTYDGGRMSMSFDGRALYFTSDRATPGSSDIYVTTRERLRGRKK